MKSKFLSLFLALFTICAAASAQEPEEQTVIIEIELEEGSDDPDNRVSQTIPIDGYYYPSLNYASLFFTGNVGSAVIYINNIMTGENNVYYQYGNGMINIPFYNPGIIQMDIYTEDRRHYRAMFIAN